MGTYAIMSGSMLQIGDQLDNYQIQGHMAQGGMSDIYRAYDMIHRREVVLKVPDQSLLGDPAQYERFQRELEVLNILQHPAIVRGLGSGRYNKIPYLVAELVEGVSLRSLIQQPASMPFEKVLDLVIKIASGLSHCHENNIIHRDLKPENILVTPEGQPVIIDFGLALTPGAHRITYSNLSAVAGTPDYMAPEQIEGHRGDARTDIYALGTIFFELLGGRTPFHGDTNLAVMSQHLKGNLPRLDRLQPSVPPQLAAIAARCLQRNPGDRYQSMQELIGELENWQAVDLAILERIPHSSPGFAFWQQPSIKAIAYSLGIMVMIILLAVVLQALRP